MDLILFSGNSLAHKEWIRDVEQKLKPLFDRTYAQMYKHWEEKSPVILLDYELKEAEKVINEYNNYVIFGKSAGTLLALKGISKGVFKPEKCVFVGLPVEWGRSYGFKVDNWARNYKIPTLFIQKKYDPVLFYEDLISYIDEQNIKNAKTLEVPGTDHYYGDLELLKEKVKEFLVESKRS